MHFPYIYITKENLWLFYNLGQQYLVTDLTESCAAFSQEHLQVKKHKATVTASVYFTPAEVAEVYSILSILTLSRPMQRRTSLHGSRRSIMIFGLRLKPELSQDDKMLRSLSLSGGFMPCRHLRPSSG